VVSFGLAGGRRWESLGLGEHPRQQSGEFAACTHVARASLAPLLCITVGGFVGKRGVCCVVWGLSKAGGWEAAAFDPPPLWCLFLFGGAAFRSLHVLFERRGTPLGQACYATPLSIVAYCSTSGEHTGNIDRGGGVRPPLGVEVPSCSLCARGGAFRGSILQVGYESFGLFAVHGRTTTASLVPLLPYTWAPNQSRLWDRVGLPIPTAWFIFPVALLFVSEVRKLRYPGGLAVFLVCCAIGGTSSRGSQVVMIVFLILPLFAASNYGTPCRLVSSSGDVGTLVSQHFCGVFSWGTSSALERCQFYWLFVRIRYETPNEVQRTIAARFRPLVSRRGRRGMIKGASRQTWSIAEEGGGG